MTSLKQDIIDFHEKFGLEYNGSLRELPDDLAAFRIGFLREEAAEYDAAVAADDDHGAFDALIDEAYVALGTIYLMGGIKISSADDLLKNSTDYTAMSLKDCIDCLAHSSTFLPSKPAVLDYIIGICIETSHNSGWDFEEGWRRVHAANMAKVRAERPGDSKRGSTFDVVKPEGWTAPDLSDLVRKPFIGVTG
jgi:predicted HAD superfamily Cof-like phosphohydrolase